MNDRMDMRDERRGDGKRTKEARSRSVELRQARRLKRQERAGEIAGSR